MGLDCDQPIAVVAIANLAAEPRPTDIAQPWALAPHTRISWHAATGQAPTIQTLANRAQAARRRRLRSLARPAVGVNTMHAYKRKASPCPRAHRRGNSSRDLNPTALSDSICDTLTVSLTLSGRPLVAERGLRLQALFAWSPPRLVKCTQVACDGRLANLGIDVIVQFAHPQTEFGS